MKIGFFRLPLLLIFLFCGQSLTMAASSSKTHDQDWAQSVADAELFFSGDSVHITGFAVGVAGIPGEFYVFSQQLLQIGTSDDFEALLTSQNVALRAFGVVGFVRLNPKADKIIVEQTLADIFKDKTKVQVTDSGCMGASFTLGEWAQNFWQNPNSLGHDNPGGVQRASDPYFLANAFYYRGQGVWDKKEYLKARDFAEAGLRQIGPDNTQSKLTAARTQIEKGQIRDGTQLLLQTLRERLDLFLQKSK